MRHIATISSGCQILYVYSVWKYVEYHQELPCFYSQLNFLQKYFELF